MGIGQSQKVVFIGDGAAWIWELARTHFPLAILILDFYHMMEYLHELSQLLYGLHFIALHLLLPLILQSTGPRGVFAVQELAQFVEVFHPVIEIQI